MTSESVSHTTPSYTGGVPPQNFFASRRPVGGKLVAVMQGRLDGRGLKLILQPSRAVCRGEIHELIVSTEQGIGPGSTVNRVTYIGFIEFDPGGVIYIGDTVRIGNMEIGRIAGFDSTHLPNHMNIVIAAAELKSGLERGLSLEQVVAIQGVPSENEK